MTEDPKQDPITEDHKKNTITKNTKEYPKEDIITENR